MGTWFWLNIPLMLLFFGCWAGIPLWLTLTRWKDEIETSHAKIAARAAAQLAITQSAPYAAVAREVAGPAYAEMAARPGL
jgi:hypothetical protein